MKLQTVTCYAVEIPAKDGSYAMSRDRVLRSFPSTVVRVTAEDGTSGFGEACSLGGNYFDGFPGSIQATIRELAPFVLQCDPLEPNVLADGMDALIIGHLTKAARIRDLAQASGLKILLDEPQGADLATAALAQLAATIDPGHFLGTGCFIGPHMPFSYQKAGPSGPGPQFDDGTLQRGNAPGLGVDVDEDVLGPPLFQLAR